MPYRISGKESVFEVMIGGRFGSYIELSPK
jgi:hypothetical protein